MSEERLKALLKKGKGDTSLQEKLKGAASPDAAVEIAKDAGFAITAITTFFFAITIIGPHTTVQAQTQTERLCWEYEERGEDWWRMGREWGEPVHSADWIRGNCDRLSHWRSLDFVD